MSAKQLTYAIAAFAVIAAAGQAKATPLLLWGNNATTGPDYVEAFDPTNGAVVHQFDVDPVGNLNGRGVVIVGNTGYATNANNGVIQEFNATTGALGGTINTGHGSFASITYDGTGFWISDYTGGNQAFHVLLNGTTDKTITLGNCGGNCDGLNYYIDPTTHKGVLISNRGDEESPGIYDVYDTNGNLLHADLITNNDSGSTGIAFNPFNDEFYVSNINQNSFSTFDIDGNFLATTTLGLPIPPCGACRLIEGLSFDYSQTIPTPEPASLLLLGAGLLGLGLARRR